MKRKFCHVVKVREVHAVVSIAHFASQESVSLREFDGSFAADEYAKQVNSLAATFKDPRAAAAKEAR